MEYQWYPGHMTKTIRELQENMKLIDLVIEIADARIPYSGRNPEIDRLAEGKSRLIFLGKDDLADPAQTERWSAYFRERGIMPYACDLRNRSSLKGAGAVIREAVKEKTERLKRRGITGRPIRAMVAGIPNVGKSTFINSFSGSSSAKTGNRPGVTKGRQWIRISKDIQLLDTPGLLWPKFENRETGQKIAFIGSMPDTILDTAELACELIVFLRERDAYRDFSEKRYGVACDGEPSSVLKHIGRARGCLRAGNVVDLEKAARVLLDDFRSGRLGRITLETVDEI